MVSVPAFDQHAPRSATFYTVDKREEPPEWLRQAAQNVDALISSALPIIRAAQEYVDQALATQATSGSRHHTASGHLTVIPTFVARAEVGVATDTLRVVRQDMAGHILVPASAVAVAPWLLLLIAFALSLGETRLSPEQHQFLSDYITNFALALAVAWRISDNDKR